MKKKNVFDEVRWNAFQDEIPKNISLYFLKPKEKLFKLDRLKKNKKKYLLSKIKYYYKKRLFYYLSRFEKIDIFIDFKLELWKISHKLKKYKPIVWLHTSPKMHYNTLKIRKRLMYYSKVILICEDMKKEFRTIHPNLENKLEVIYNPFNFNELHKKSEEISTLNEKEIRLLSENYILMVSRICLEQKDHKTLIKVYKILKNKGIKKKLYIVGSGKDYSELKKILIEENLEDDILLLGEKQNPYIWMKYAKCFVLSTQYEGLPTVIIESMILNKIVIATDCPTGPKEILQDGKCGLLVKLKDPNDLAEKLYSVLLNIEYYEEKFKKNMESRIQDFSIDKTMEKFYRLIESI